MKRAGTTVQVFAGIQNFALCVHCVLGIPFGLFRGLLVHAPCYAYYCKGVDSFPLRSIFTTNGDCRRNEPCITVMKRALHVQYIMRNHIPPFLTVVLRLALIYPFTWPCDTHM